MSMTIAQLARQLGLEFRGDSDRELSRVSGWEDADDRSLLFWEGAEGSATLPPQSTGACVIARPGTVPLDWSIILSDHPKLDFARAAALLQPVIQGTGVRHPTAIIDPEASVDPTVDVGPWVSVAARAAISAGTVLHAGVVVGAGATIGRDCTLYPRVVLYPGAVIGNRVVLHAGVVVGGDGFGFISDGKQQVKFPQVGRVIIEDDVEVGSNSTLDRGSLGTTRIGSGTKIDNLVQVAHNVQIGKRVIIAAQTGVSGSTVIEDDAIIMGQVGLADHVRVQSGAIVGAKAGVPSRKIIRGGDVYWGIPARPLGEFKRLYALYGRLPDMKEALTTLRKEFDAFRKAMEEKNG